MSRRIVVLLSDLPLPFGNAAARWYYVLLRGLVERGHRVTAFVVGPEGRRGAEVAALFPAPDYDLRLYDPPRRGGPRARFESLRRPYSYLFGPDLRRDLDAELARGCDVLHAELTWTGWLAHNHADRAVVNVHSLYGIDLSEMPADSVVDRVRRLSVFRAERALLRRFPTILTLTPRLTDAVRRISPRSAVHTNPLGLDLSLYPFEPESRPRAEPGPVVGLIGSFNWEPTLSAGRRLLTRLWPEIRRRVPDARLQVVGRVARAALGSLATGPGVSVHEDVPDTIPYFRGTDVLLYAPGPATGMKVKVLEAFALGVAVVTNADGVEGLPALDGVHAGLAEDDAGLIDRTVALLADPARRARMRHDARALVETHCSPGPVLDRLDAVHAEIAARRARGPARLPG